MLLRPILPCLFVLLAACSGERQSAEEQASGSAPANSTAHAVADVSVAISDPDLVRVCKGGAAFRNGRSPEGISAKLADGRIVRLSYVRDDDGKAFEYDCEVQGNVVRYRMIDEAGAGTGPGTWSGRGSKTTFEIGPASIRFKDDFFDGSTDKEEMVI